MSTTVKTSVPRCIEKVWNGWNHYQCRNKGKMTHEGKPYCGTHDPVKKAASRSARSNASDKKWAAQKAGWAREAAVKALGEDSLVIAKAMEAGGSRMLTRLEAEAVRTDKELAQCQAALNP